MMCNKLVLRKNTLIEISVNVRTERCIRWVFDLSWSRKVRVTSNIRGCLRGISYGRHLSSAYRTFDSNTKRAEKHSQETRVRPDRNRSTLLSAFLSTFLWPSAGMVDQVSDLPQELVFIERMWFYIAQQCFDEGRHQFIRPRLSLG